ncbi:MAG: GNAT family N-acetyltransferase [Bdellovibrionaceae bacterium]|jgi:ribosomal protein S18 acetylase RimI-like enzyme|nr:GNAT family N-acetyltransferase [Pseudobdellovibrionaceae bacterium]
MKIYEVLDIFNKERISSEILRSLPDWFGIEDSTVAYINGCKTMPMYVMEENEKAIGFISLHKHFQKSCELYVLGILQEYHRKGLGKKLITHAECEAKKNGFEFMTVKTLSEGRPDKFYDKTRAFYLGIGYAPLEEFKTLWDESNPCLLMIKYLGN